jgi:putative ABC transport system permease protein
MDDIRYAIRMLIRAKTYTTVSVLCLGLGIGVNTTIFTVVNGVIVRQLPFDQPDRLLVLHETPARDPGDTVPLSYPNLRDWQQASWLVDIAAVGPREVTLSDDQQAERYEGAAVTWNLFPVLGVHPALGRPFRADDDRLGAAPVVILGDLVWQRRYGGDRAVIGRSVQVNGTPHTIVGVMPPRFAFPERQRLWIPLVPVEHARARGDRTLFAYGRLRPGATIEHARAEIAGIAARLERQYPADNGGWGALVRPLTESVVPARAYPLLFTMMGAVAFVLLIACANVANLLLARATVRRREIAVRAALGAGRARIVRQLLTESVSIGVLCVPLGVGLAAWGIRLFERAIPQQGLPYYFTFPIDVRVLLYTVGLSIFTGLLFGVAPSLQATRGDLQAALRQDGRGASPGMRGNRLRSTLVVGQIALALVLLIGASLCVRSFVNLLHANPGFDTSPLLTLRVEMSGERYASAGAIGRRVDDLLQRIEALPGVEAATASSLIPLGGGGGFDAMFMEGRTVRRDEAPIVFSAGVSPHFLRTLNTPILRGRDFTDREGLSLAPVTIINETMARRLWPEEDPIGRRLRFDTDRSGPWFTVIGVMRDIYTSDLDEAPLPSAYIPYPYRPATNTGLTIRTTRAAEMTASIREAIHAADPNLPIFDIRTMEQVRLAGFWHHRLLGSMFSIFGLVALLLAVVGVYGVLSYVVSQRVHEIGVRVALGAEPRNVVALVLRHGLSLTVAGVAVGLLGAFAVSRVLRAQLYGVSPTDPLSCAGLAAALTIVSLLAVYLPARRAATVDPMVALRQE